MFREWEDGGLKVGQQRAKDPRAPERKAPKSGALGAGQAAKDQDPLWGHGDRDSIASMRSWTKVHSSDPSIAPGKYSPLEKEILRLGGVHTAASRRLLTRRLEEERKVLRELQLRSSDYKRALEHRRQFPAACAAGGLLERLWTAEVAVTPRELRVPPREQLDICRHVERMQVARALRHRRPLPAIRRAGPPGSPPAATGEGAADAEGEDGAGPRQEIQMKVRFKSKEPPKPLTHQPGDLKPFFPPRRGERAIAGCTNRSLFRLADFPGDLMLMNQDFLSRSLGPSAPAGASPCPGQAGFCRAPPCRPA